MTGYENKGCGKFMKNQRIAAMLFGPERHSSFHDELVCILLTRPKPKGEKPEVRHHLECRGKPRHEPPIMEFQVDSANNYLDRYPPENPPPPPKCEGKTASVSNFKSKAVYCEVKLAELLGKAGPRTRPSTPGKYEDAPDSCRASVCCLGAAAGRDE